MCRSGSFFLALLLIFLKIALALEVDEVFCLVSFATFFSIQIKSFAVQSPVDRQGKAIADKPPQNFPCSDQPIHQIGHKNATYLVYNLRPPLSPLRLPSRWTRLRPLLQQSSGPQARRSWRFCTRQRQCSAFSGRRGALIFSQPPSTVSWYRRTGGGKHLALLLPPQQVYTKRYVHRNRHRSVQGKKYRQCKRLSF